MRQPRVRSLRCRPWLPAFLILCAFAGPLPAEDIFLSGGRFRVAATFETAAGPGVGQGVVLSDHSGTFWFFSPDNVELIVKVIDACAPPFERFWFFAAGLTNVEVEIAVEDIFSGETRRYSNAAGTAFQPIQDTAAFATCGVERACGQGSASEIAATPRADTSLEALALVLSDRVAARQSTYDRLVADVAAIRARFPDLAGATFLPAYDPSSLLVLLTPEAAAAVRAGNYHEWDCLNDWYDVRDVRLFQAQDIAVVRFHGLLRTDRVAPEYLALDGVLAAEQDFFTLPPLAPLPGELCARAEGTRFHYLVETFDNLRRLWYLTTAAPGAEPVLVDDFVFFPITNPPVPFLSMFESCLEQSLQF